MPAYISFLQYPEYFLNLTDRLPWITSRADGGTGARSFPADLCTFLAFHTRVSRDPLPSGSLGGNNGAGHVPPIRWFLTAGKSRPPRAAARRGVARSKMDRGVSRRAVLPIIAPRRGEGRDGKPEIGRGQLLSVLRWESGLAFIVVQGIERKGADEE